MDFAAPLVLLPISWQYAKMLEDVDVWTLPEHRALFFSPVHELLLHVLALAFCLRECDAGGLLAHLAPTGLLIPLRSSQRLVANVIFDIDCST